MASAADSKLHWCTEEIPIGSKYFLSFEQSFQDPQFLGSLQREGSWIGDAPLITDHFDVSRLQYLVPTLRCATITGTDPKQIEAQLVEYSQYLLQPKHAFIHLFPNFDFYGETEYFPSQNIPNHEQYIESIPLFTGNIINKSLINCIHVLMQKDALKSLKICQDIARTGRGLRCLYPQQYNTSQHRFVVRATVEYQYPGAYILQQDAMEVLLMDKDWNNYVKKRQTIGGKQQNNIKLWKPLFIESSHSSSLSSASVSDEEELSQSLSPKIRSVSQRIKKKKSRYFSPFILYDFSQNRYSSRDNNLDQIVSALSHSAREAAKAANMQRAFDNKISKCQIYMILSTKDYDDAPRAFVYRLNILSTEDVNQRVKGLNQRKDDAIAKLMINIIANNIDEYHCELLQAKYCTANNFIQITQQILQFLTLKETAKERSNLLLLQERAIIILADVIWTFYKRYYAELLQWLKSKNIENIVREFVSVKEENIKQLCFEIESLKQRKPSNNNNNNDDLAAYYGFLEPFLKASNEKELQDFNECAQVLLSKHRNMMNRTEMKYGDSNCIYSTSCGMRVGISSANASDNWTNSKLNGGVTINMSINLDSIQGTPVMAQVQCIPNKVQIELNTKHTMNGDVTQDTIVFTQENIHEFLKMDDNRDVFRMLKYSLIFVGIIVDPQLQNKKEKENNCYSSILSDVAQFTGGCGLSLSVTNLGPSRSGFASSSAVACNILKVLYACCGSDIAQNDQLLGSMALLFENRLGLKSGRQDVDGLLPNGVKVLHYNCTTQFVAPKISFLSQDRFNIKQLSSKMILVNSGIARASGLGLHRGLNMRFLAYLSRDPVRFKSILQSYLIHDDIIDALQFNNYCLLGKLFLDYMSCRERIDPGATQSKYDKDEGNEKILRRLFDPLVAKQLIYGGMFTGAMGGGVAMLSLTPFASETSKGNKEKTNIEAALQELKQWKTKHGSQPFQRLAQIQYSVNVNGIKLNTSYLDGGTCNIVTKLIKKEYLFKSMHGDDIICLDDNFSETVFSVKGLIDKEIKQIEHITKQAKYEKKDVNIVVIERHTKDGNVQYNVSHAKTI